MSDKTIYIDCPECSGTGSKTATRSINYPDGSIESGLFIESCYMCSGSGRGLVYSIDEVDSKMKIKSSTILFLIMLGLVIGFLWALYDSGKLGFYVWPVPGQDPAVVVCFFECWTLNP